MSTELNKLFEQIFRSERHAKAKADHLKSLGAKIQELRFELLQVEDEASSKEGELAVKNNKLFDIDVDVKFLEKRKQIQRELLQSIRTLNHQMENDLETKKKDHQAVLKLNLDQLTEFSCQYDMQTSGYTRRQEECKSGVFLLHEECQFLEKEVVEVAAQRDQYQEAYQNICELKGNLSQNKIKLAELLSVLKGQEAELESLMQEHVLNQNVDKDIEFNRLQRELEVSKNCIEESECATLQTQLEHLQCQCYHKKMQQQVRIPCIDDAAISGSNNGHYNPYTFQLMPVPVSQNLTDSETCKINNVQDIHVPKTCVESNSVQDMTINERILTEQNLKSLHVADAAFTSESYVTDLKGDLPAQENLSGKSRSIDVSPKEPITSHLHFKQRLSHSSCYHPMSSTSSTISNHYQKVHSNAGCLLRKRPGQSIYKAPGAQMGFVKKTKKVRFNH